jgi:NAD(P)-dependent dehydrogenase (short-subunit alcohol dehydrogenase family)
MGRTGLKLKTRGSIVNVGSLCSHVAINTLSPYIMAKHGKLPFLQLRDPTDSCAGVLGLTKADALDYAKEGIRINCISPGWIKTKMTEPLWSSPIASTYNPYESIALTTVQGVTLAARAPMNRFGLPEEVAYLVSFLSSDKASFITGGDYGVDGGYRAC